jgi:hypothetical protein
MGKIDSADKSMGSYEKFAWDDACSIAGMLCETYGFEKVKTAYTGKNTEAIKDFEGKNKNLIAEYLSKTESARPAYIKSISKEATEGERIMFLVLSILALVRVYEILMLRDVYRHALNPGLGNRITTKAIYEFSNRVAQEITYEWPSEVFDAIGEYSDDSDDTNDVVDAFAFDEPEVKVEEPKIPKNQLLVFVKPSPRFALDAKNRIVSKEDSAAYCDLWQIALADQRGNKSYVRYLSEKPSDEQLGESIKEVLENPTSGFITCLAVTKSLQKEYPVVDKILNEYPGRFYYANVGAARGEESKWADEYLSDLVRELALINAPWPTIEELNKSTMESSLLCLEQADEDCVWFERRSILMNLVNTLLQFRGFTPQDKFTENVAVRGNYNLARFINPKEMNTLDRYYSQGRLTDIGKALWSLGKLATQWRNNPENMPAISKTIAGLLMPALLNEGRDRRDMVHTYPLIPYSTQESDLIEYSVYRELNNGIPSRWLKNKFPHAHQDRDIIYFGFWIPVELKYVKGLGLLRYVPKHLTIQKFLTNKYELPIKSIIVGRHIESHARKNDGANVNWADRYKFFSDVTRFGKSITDYENESPKKSWFCENDVPSDKSGLVQVIIGFQANEGQVMEKESAIEAIKDLPKLLQEQIKLTLEIAGLQKNSIDVINELYEYTYPNQIKDKRLKMLISNTYATN